MSRFTPFALRDDVALDVDGVHVRAWASRRVLDGGTVFGCIDQPTTLTMDGDRFVLRAGMWFVAPDGVEVHDGRGLGIIVPGYRGLRQLGGPIETKGRLRYIDGCSDTLIVAPPRRGDPCLNHLHIPARTLQSAHTHPSLRVGIIARGAGTCVTHDGRYGLEPGLGWLIPTGLEHAFHTDQHSLDVLAWHPETDTGPIDDDHPMLNRTLRVS